MRKLAWASLSFAAAIAMRHYVIPEVWKAAIMIALVIAGVVGGIFTKDKLRIKILLVCIFSVLGIIRYDIQFHTKLKPTEEYVGQIHQITAVVSAFPEVYDDYSRITVNLFDEGLPKTKAYIYDYSGNAEFLYPGQMILGTVKFSSALLSSGEKTDTYISKGIYLRGYLQDKPIVVGEWKWSFLYIPLRIADQIREQIDTHMPQRTAVFMKALLTGDKTALYDEGQIYNQLTRSGLAHVVAVSGMHVSFLIGLIMILFGNYIGWLFAIAAVVIFAIMTGMSPSIMRALFMQVLYLLAPVVRRESDGITSISFALFILLIANPFSIASLSLQLSFASMMGIVVITPRMIEWFGHRKPKTAFLAGIYTFVTASLALSLGTSLVTAPLIAYYFGYVSLLSPLTNLLVVWIVPICFGGGFLLCALSLVADWAAAVIALCVSGAVEFIYAVAGLMAEIPITVIYLPNNLLILWFLVSYAIILFTYFRKEDKSYKAFIPFSVILLSLLALHVCVIEYYRNSITVAAVDVGQGQSIAVLDEEKTLIVDCGGIYDSGERTAQWLYTHGRYSVDALVITHFDEDHINGILDLMGMIHVNKIIYSDKSLTDEKVYLLNEIKDLSDDTNTDVILIEQDVSEYFGDSKITCFVSDKKGSNTGIMVLVQNKSFDLLITGDATSAAERSLVKNYDLPDGEILVVGHHGSKSSTSEQLLETFAPEYAIISCGYNSYGHPTQEVLDRLEDRNVVIYRTDLLGSIEMRVR